MWFGKMGFLLILFYIIVSQTCAFEDDDDSLEIILLEDSQEAAHPVNPIEPREFFTSWHVRRAARKILKRMPCGWPQYGIPPLAPYKNDNLTFNISNDLISAFISLKLLQIDGLNEMDIDRLTVDIWPHKAKFDFNFSNITATSKFEIYWAWKILTDLGLNTALNAKGELNFSLENLRINGTAKYKMPLIFGSAKISDLELNMSMGNVRSALKGAVNRIPITKLLNRQIEKNVLKYFNEYQRFVSPLLAQILETQVNSELYGKILWHLLRWTIGKKSDKCVVEQAQSLKVINAKENFV